VLLLEVHAGSVPAASGSIGQCWFSGADVACPDDSAAAGGREVEQPRRARTIRRRSTVSQASRVSMGAASDIER
jgi:hypothetical protein